MSPEMIYEVSATARCWRLHDCVECGCAYRYLCARQVNGVGGTADQAAEHANQAAAQALQEAVEVHPCPQCGLVQPYMTTHKKYQRHLTVTFLAVAAVATATGIATADKFAPDKLAFVIAGATAVAALCHLVLALLNPNWSRSRNLRVAQQEVASGRVEVVRQGESDDYDPRTKIFGFGHAFYLLLAVAAVGAALVPVVVAQTKGWHWNPDVSPHMVSPGDTVRVGFPETVFSANEMWNARPVVTVENAPGIGPNPPVFTAHAKADDWSKVSAVKSKNAVASLWTDIAIPADETLVGKSLTLKVDLPVRFPRSGVEEPLLEEKATASRVIDLTISPTGAATDERQYRLAGAGTAAGLVFVSGLGLTGLAWQLRRRCSPGLMQPFEQRAEARGFGTSRATMFGGGEEAEPEEAPAPATKSRPWDRW